METISDEPNKFIRNGLLSAEPATSSNEAENERVWSSNDTFGKIICRKLSSYRRPSMNRQNTDANRRAKYQVEISFILIRLGEIDTLHETFFAEAFLEARWTDKTLTHDTCYDPDKHWNPEIIVENAIKSLSIKKTYSIKERDNEKKGIYVSEKWILKGIFWKSLTLKNFPIDVQELTISIASLKPINEVKFVQSQAKLSAVIQEGFIDQQEWKLYSFLTCKEVIVSNKFSADEYPSFLISAYTRRRPNYYYYNAFFLILLITISSLTIFGMGCHLPQSRLQTTCTVLLTSITFKWVINRSLPTVYYLTSLDFYSLINIFLICVKCIWHAIIGHVNNRYIEIANRKKSFNDTTISSNQCHEIYFTYDYYAFLLFICSVVILNLSFVYWYFFKAKRESNKLDYKEMTFMNEIKKEDIRNENNKNNQNNSTRKYRYKSIYVHPSTNKCILNQQDTTTTSGCDISSNNINNLFTRENIYVNNNNNNKHAQNRNNFGYSKNLDSNSKGNSSIRRATSNLVYSTNNYQHLNKLKPSILAPVEEQQHQSQSRELLTPTSIYTIEGTSKTDL